MKTFKMIRHEDVKTVSGIGLVAIGVDFGTHVALTWVTNARIEQRDGTFKTVHISTLTFFGSIQDVQDLHGHGSRTDVVLDQAFDIETFKVIQQKISEISQKITKVAA